MTSSIIPLSEALRAAHRGATYNAATPRSMPLKVDVHSTDLTQLLRKRFAQTAALITAHNPASKKQTPAKNKKANAALQARIEAMGLAWLPGHRKAFKDTDPDEEGFLVFNITGGQLEELMVEFDQEVALWCPSSGTPVLMLHPLARRIYSAAEIAWEKAMKEAGKSAYVRPSTKSTDSEADVPAPVVKPGRKKSTKNLPEAEAAPLPVASKIREKSTAKNAKPKTLAVPEPTSEAKSAPKATRRKAATTANESKNMEASVTTAPLKSVKPKTKAVESFPVEESPPARRTKRGAKV